MKKILFLILALISSQVIADSVSHNGKIKRIYPLADGAVVLVFENPSSSCSRSDNYHYVRTGANGMSEEGVKNIYSLALMAASTDKEVTIIFSSSNTECAINRAFVAF